MDTFVTALYGKVDDTLRDTPALRLRRPEVGIVPKLSDTELVTMAVVQSPLGMSSEARFLRHARKHLRTFFPYDPGQSGYNERLRKSEGQLGSLIRVRAADTVLFGDDTWVIDSTPVECGRSGETAKRSDLVGFAGHGYCASYPSQSRYFWGLRLHLVCTPARGPVPRAPAPDHRVDQGHPKDQLDPEAHGGHTPGGVVT